MVQITCMMYVGYSRAVQANQTEMCGRLFKFYMGAARKQRNGI